MLTSKLASGMVSLRLEACEFALVFCWLSCSFVLTGSRFGGAVAKMHQGVVSIACRILDDDYVTGYTVDDDFYCDLWYAARVLPMLTS